MLKCNKIKYISFYKIAYKYKNKINYGKKRNSVNALKYIINIL